MKKGFTLIELLVVVLIIGILSAVALPQYQKAVQKARVSELFAIVKNLKEQQELFYLANGYYADTCEEMAADLPAGFVDDPDDARPGYYSMKKGNFKLKISCLNGTVPKEVGGRVFGYARITSGEGVNIESFFDHITDSPKAGRSFCYAKNPRGVDICKSLGKEKISNESYWL